MKKILVATTILATASAALAADVSGYAIFAYKKDSAKNIETKSLANEAEVYISASKTTANGITFGGTFTIGQEASNEAKLKNTDFSVGNNYTHLNTFVSHSMAGKIAFGRLSSAGRSIGAASLAVGNGFLALSNHFAARHRSDRGSIVYTTPTFYGVSASYSTEIGHKYGSVNKGNSVNSLALNYSGKFSDVNVSGAFTSDTVNGIGERVYALVNPTTTSIPTDSIAKDTAFGFKVGYKGLAFSYTMAERKIDKVSAGNKPSNKHKENRFGLEYSFAGASIGYSQNKITDIAKQVKEVSVMTASYKVADGLSVFAEQGQSKYTKSVVDATNNNRTDKTTFIGTKVSF